jgi:hypothetical protein
MASTDNNNIKLTDHDGTLHTPETSVTLTIGNTRVDDVVTVYLESGSTGLPSKTQYTSHNTSNVQSGSTFDRDSTSFPNDTPTSGSFTVVDLSANQEHRYRYTAWSGTQLTLPTEVTGAADAASTGQTLVDISNNFTSLGVVRGDIIRNITDSGWGYVIAISTTTNPNDTLTTTQLTSSGKDWASGDTYEINSLVVSYDNTDKFFIPYIDAIEDTGTDEESGSVTQDITYASQRSVVIRVRNVASANPIQPFETTSNITLTGMTVSVIRTDDDVYA